jgi:predicted TIM-barrel fold metal-dependent hydrolase
VRCGDDLRGVLISSSHRGAYPDDADARPFFALATELDIPVFMHPPSVGFGEERMREFRLASSVGRPFDACLALARLIVNGVFEQFPRLKFVASHLGGGICEIIGRMDYAYELRDDPYILGPYGPPLHITRKPSDYLRTIYFDTVCYHAPAAECAIKTVGADRLIFGTDSPMLVALKQRGLDLVRNLDLGAADKDRILGGTARMLLKL